MAAGFEVIILIIRLWSVGYYGMPWCLRVNSAGPTAMTAKTFSPLKDSIAVTAYWD